MYQSILVPTDGSDHAHRAASDAGAVAAHLDASVHVVSALDLAAIGGPFDAGGISEDRLARFEERAEGWVQETRRYLPDGVQSTSAVVRGRPAEAIVDYAQEVDVDLIAMGTHGRSGVDRYVLGSVTERVLRTAPAPVYTVKAEDRPGPGKAYEDVLIPTDGSERAAAAIDHGLTFANLAGARVHAVTIVRNEGAVDWEIPPDLSAAIETAADEAVAKVAERARAAGLEGVTARQQGDPAAKLLDYVDEANIDLIAMGTQGRTGLNRYLLGSTTERVVRHAPVPVLAVNARPRE